MHYSGSIKKTLMQAFTQSSWSRHIYVNIQNGINKNMAVNIIFCGSPVMQTCFQHASLCPSMHLLWEYISTNLLMEWIIFFTAMRSWNSSMILDYISFLCREWKINILFHAVPKHNTKNKEDGKNEKKAQNDRGQKESIGQQKDKEDQTSDGSKTSKKTSERERERREKREWERGKDKTQAELSKAGTAERTRHLYCAPQRQGHCEKSAAQHRLTQHTAVPVHHPQKNHMAMPCSSCCSAMTPLLNCTTPQTNPAKDNKKGVNRT